jgi:hypothetical protein
MKAIVKLWSWIGVRAHAFGGIVKSMLTGPDGASWAPGRIMGLATFAVAQCLVIKASAAMIPLMRTPADWLTFFTAVGGFQAGTGATCIGLVLGMAPADSGGKWWGRDASPPPPLGPTLGRAMEELRR